MEIPLPTIDDAKMFSSCSVPLPASTYSTFVDALVESHEAPDGGSTARGKRLQTKMKDTDHIKLCSGVDVSVPGMIVRL